MSRGHIKPWTSNPKWGDCHRCGAFMVTVAVHECPPAYTVRTIWRGQPEDDGVEVRAHSGEDAAIRYADRHDSDRHEMGIVRDGLEVEVTAPDGTTARFKIEGEMVPSYTAEEIEP